MITAALILLAQPIVPPPEVNPVNPVIWNCQASGPLVARLTLSGSFPAVSAEAQKDSSAFHLQTRVESNNAKFVGSFPGAMREIGGTDRYSIYVGDGPSALKYLIMFDFFPVSQDGFVQVTAYDRGLDVPSAYAAGICKLQVAK